MAEAEYTKLQYTSQGSVRGWCGHAHRRLDTALKCIERDHRGCKTQGGYSDRQAMRLLNGKVYDLSEAEFLFTVWEWEGVTRPTWP